MSCSTCPSRSTGAYATAQLPGVHPRTVRPTERSPRAQNTDARSRGTRDNAVYGCVTWSPRACHMEFTSVYVLVSKSKNKKTRGRILAQEIVGSFMGLCYRASESSLVDLLL